MPCQQNLTWTLYRSVCSGYNLGDIIQHHFQRKRHEINDFLVKYHTYANFCDKLSSSIMELAFNTNKLQQNQLSVQYSYAVLSSLLFPCKPFVRWSISFSWFSMRPFSICCSNFCRLYWSIQGVVKGSLPTSMAYIITPLKIHRYDICVIWEIRYHIIIKTLCKILCKLSF